MSPVTLGARIVAARRARGWTQYELAAEIGVARNTVSRWEIGAGIQSDTHRRLLADVLGIDQRGIQRKAARRIPS